MLPKKVWLSKIPAITFLYRSLWAQIFHKKLSNFPKKPKKTFLLIGLVRSGEIPSPQRTSIDKTNDCVMNSARGALGRAFDPPSGHSVHNTAGDTWRAPARRLIQKHLPTGVPKTDDKNLDPSPMVKKWTFFRFGRERRTPRATSRLLDHGSTWYFRGRHLHSLALPATKRVGRGLILCRDRRYIVSWAVFDQQVNYFQRKSPGPAACSGMKK